MSVASRNITDNESILPTLNFWYSFRPVLFAKSIIVGVVTGFIVVALRIGLTAAHDIRKSLYEALSEKPLPIQLGWVFLLVIAGLLIGYTIKRYPLIRGSGIPQVKGALNRQIRLSWFPELFLKFFGGIVGIGAGLSLGREGPCVQLGSYVGLSMLHHSKTPNLERKYLITSGAAAGLSAAFNAPLAGVIFVLEEMHKSFSPLLLVCSMASSTAADFVASHFFGLRPIFDFHAINVIPQEYFHFAIILGIVIAFVGHLFKKALYFFQDFYVRLRIPVILRPVLPLLLSVLLGLYCFDVTGGGHHLIESLCYDNKTLLFLSVLLCLKFLFTTLCYGSGNPGGIFLPLLLIGALVGQIYGGLLQAIGLIDSSHNMNFMIMGMAANFTAIVRAPVTGAILILEMSGNFNHLLGLVGVCMSTYLVGSFIKSRPVYDVLLDRLIHRNPGIFVGNERRKVILEIPVSIDSFLEHKQVAHIDWPEGTVLIGIMRGEKEFIPKPKTEILPGDQLLILASEEDAGKVQMSLIAMGASPED
ncbi:ClC family H(+)/Cl(-) exchange transporter [Sediminispirochaeta bajacaliforniensis]|uniref:ClC family H(+)/Cl(-) exchange transporter n=1 Tax=Sediminispirochaeta bajacaliforniensis TaxID=148 RepID=UPI0004768BAC|nr:ClC family H(+)/Cl(-) exchange transporter [Sediminispirochaeta bajacaliforniensis]